MRCYADVCVPVWVCVGVWGYKGICASVCTCVGWDDGRARRRDQQGTCGCVEVFAWLDFVPRCGFCGEYFCWSVCQCRDESGGGMSVVGGGEGDGGGEGGNDLSECMNEKTWGGEEQP